MKKIRRSKIVEGTTIPGVICNGGQYFYIDVDIYDDGMTNCWELVDLKGLKNKINSNWLTPVVPVGQNLSIHGLGAFQVKEANWRFNQESYYEHIEQTIRLLNPEFVNIYEISEREQKQWEARRVAHSPRPTDFYVKSELFYQTAEGDGFNIFMKNEGANYLVHLNVYQDGQVMIYNLPQDVQCHLDEANVWFQDGTLFTTFDRELPIRMAGLGEVTLSEPLYAAEIEEKHKEFMDLHKKLNGEKTALEECRDAYYLYLENPIEFYREKLREKYERVPEHERMYLGDMDTKDWDYQRILYRPDEKREV
ncbi:MULTISPECIES: DUF7638 domain-containing protein [Paenibacillus]|uniref:Uncharacterized protein n=1 Tax=Paenibacillus lautus TaxID=1401 RepID=A0A1R1AW71_PAELA|nr:hypothetical protein [Paenibacillus lautus]OME89808.1 hypothetical protein BK123_25980 [Paenibacillus lautus]